MDWKNLVGTIAPWIGTALGGPLGGMAISALGDALGLSDKTEEAIKAAVLGANPEQLLALKNADQAFQLQMQSLGFQNIKDMEQIAASDRDSARKREMEVKDHTPRNLAYSITVGYFLTLAMLYFGQLPEGTKEILYIMLGTLGTAWIGVINYYYGSTSGSAKKSELLANSTPTK